MIRSHMHDFSTVEAINWDWNNQDRDRVSGRHSAIYNPTV